MFNKNSGLVKIWVRLINQGNYTINDIPTINNLKEVVISLINN